jgi:hypothetical protein
MPGTAWLQDRLVTAQAVGGGYERNMGSPMLSGAAFAISAVFVVAWVVALAPMLVWAGVRRLGRGSPA